MTTLFKFTVALVICLSVIAKDMGPQLWPMPQKLKYTPAEETNSVILTKESLKYKLIIENDQSNGLVAKFVDELFNFYLNHIFSEKSVKPAVEINTAGFDSFLQKTISYLFPASKVGAFLDTPVEEGYTVIIKIKDTKNVFPTDETKELYKLEVTNTTSVIEAENYVSFIRGIETFSQMVHVIKKNKVITHEIRHAPASIEDWPNKPYRSLMIDTARHFIPKDVLKRNIDALMFTKMNVFHWHITDGEAFPLELQSFPEITKTGAFDEDKIYSAADVHEIVLYGLKRGVRVIPEVDGPGHAASWGKSANLSHITTCTDVKVWYDYCASIPCGQLDPLEPDTYKVVGGVLNDLINYFPDSYIHMGGDEVNYNCWASKDSIREYMQANNETDYGKLENLFRKEQKKLLNKTQKNKKAVYWFFNVKQEVEDDDILHYWGLTNQTAILTNYSKNKVILSNHDVLYLDCGLGDIRGDLMWCGDYKTWKTMYALNVTVDGLADENILGATATLWGELNNYETIDSRVWSRTSALAERLWNVDYSDNMKENMRDIVSRLSRHERILLKRGVHTAPTTSEFCANNVDICWV